MKQVLIEQLLNDLGVDESEDINQFNISNFIRQNGVMVKLQITGGNQEISVATDELREVSEQTGKFMNSHFKASKLSFIDKKTTKLLSQIKNKARRALYNNAVTEAGNFLTVESYKEFNKVFKEAKAEFQDIVDNLTSNYFSIKEQFENETYFYLKDILSGANPEDITKIYNSVIKRIPSEEEFKNSFSFVHSVYYFPVNNEYEINDTEIEEIVEKTTSEDSLALILNTFINLGNTLFRTVYKLVTKTNLSDKELEVINRDIKRVNGLNFIESQSLNSWIDEIREIASDQNNIDNDRAEMLLATIYNEYGNRDIKNELPSIPKLTKEYLEDIEAMYC